jgi:hypothetical protein
MNAKHTVASLSTIIKYAVGKYHPPIHVSPNQATQSLWQTFLLSSCVFRSANAAWIWLWNLRLYVQFIPQDCAAYHTASDTPLFVVGLPNRWCMNGGNYINIITATTGIPTLGYNDVSLQYTLCACIITRKKTSSCLQPLIVLLR